MSAVKEGWTYKKLGELSSFISDGDWIESDDQSEVGIRLIQTGNVGNGYYIDKEEKAKFISEDTFKRLGCTEIFEGDCLISRLPEPIGRSCILPKLGTRCITAVDNTIVRTCEEIIAKYLVYYTQSINYAFLVISKTTGTTRKRISRRNLENIMIPVPPIPTQQSIVSELDKINELISLKKSQLNDLDALAQSIFYDMFGDPITNEKEWEVKKLGEVCEATSSKRIFADEYTESGIPFYRGKEITELSKNLPITLELYISNERYMEIKKDFGIPMPNDILLTAVGTIGNIWIVENAQPFYFKDGNIIWLKELDKQIISIFFKTILTILIEAFKLEMARGAAYSALTIANLKRMNIPLPPLSLQHQFAERVESIERMKQQVQTAIKDLETLLASRMQYWFD